MEIFIYVIKIQGSLTTRHGWIQGIKGCHRHWFFPTFGSACLYVGSSRTSMTSMSQVVERLWQKFKLCISMGCRICKQHLFLQQFEQYSNPYGQYPKLRRVDISEPISVKGKMKCSMWLRPGSQTYPWNSRQGQLRQHTRTEKGQPLPKRKIK